LAWIRGIETDVELLGEALELQNGRRAINVRAGEHHPLALVLLQPLGELGGGGRLAGTLQARQENDDRGLRSEIERTDTRAHQGHELVMNDLDQRLPRGEALVDFLTDDLTPHGIDEFFD